MCVGGGLGPYPMQIRGDGCNWFDGMKMEIGDCGVHTLPSSLFAQGRPPALRFPLTQPKLQLRHLLSATPLFSANTHAPLPSPCLGLVKRDVTQSTGAEQRRE